MEPTGQVEKRQTKNHMAPRTGGRNNDHEYDLEPTREESPGQRLLEIPCRRPMPQKGVVGISKLVSIEERCAMTFFKRPGV